MPTSPNWFAGLATLLPVTEWRGRMNRATAANSTNRDTTDRLKQSKLKKPCLTKQSGRPSTLPWANAPMNHESVESNTSWNQILAEIESTWPSHRWRHVGVVIGCSGGADSVTLVRALAELRQRQADAISTARGFLVVAHYNHQLRGKASDEDAEFTADLARSLDLPFALGKSEENRIQISKTEAEEIRHTETINQKNRHSDEATLRRVRMKFLTHVANEYGARYLSLAHSADDNVETVLHHLMRGTGPAGLSGIGHPLAFGHDLVLTRPLIHSRRNLIREALTERDYPWREDLSNLDCRYRRNWIRQTLIPLMESEYPHSTEAILRAIELQKSWRICIDQSAKEWLETHFECEAGTRILKDSATNPAVVIAALQQIWKQLQWPRQEMHQKHWTILSELIAGSRDGSYTFPSGLRAISEADRIIIETPTETLGQNEPPDLSE